LTYKTYRNVTVFQSMKNYRPVCFRRKITMDFQLTHSLWQPS